MYFLIIATSMLFCWYFTQIRIQLTVKKPSLAHICRFRLVSESSNLCKTVSDIFWARLEELKNPDTSQIFNNYITLIQLLCMKNGAHWWCCETTSMSLMGSVFFTTKITHLSLPWSPHGQPKKDSFRWREIYILLHHSPDLCHRVFAVCE